MKTSKVMQEHVSACMDAELTDAQIENVLAAARDEEVRQTWEVYHQIGDVLRSEDMAVAMRPDFAARMAARLEAEPTIIAPAVAQERKKPGAASHTTFFGRFAIPGMVAATVAGLAIFAGPSLTGDKGALEGVPVANVPVVAEAPASLPKEDLAPAQLTLAVAPASSSEAEQEVVLRDPHIDEYLMAHQRFSPSVYSTAPYTRASTFVSKSEADQ